MAKTLAPNNNNWSQLNDGDTRGLLLSSYNVDFDTNRGKLRVSKPALAAFTTTDDADFDSPAQAFSKYNNRYYMLADRVFRTGSADDPTDSTNWSEDTTSNVPSPAPTDLDAVVWNDFLLVIENNSSPSYGDIAKLDGSTWDRNWWSSTLSASTDQLVKLVAGPDGNLYPVSKTAKVYKLTPALAVSTTGQGTLDLSERPYTFTTAVANTTRMWIGFENEDNGTGGVIEWDMAATSISPNRTHQLGSPVRCLAVWNDTIIALLQNGNIKYNAGSGFVDWPNVFIPKNLYPLDNDFVKKNSWAIIDGLPHFLLNFELNVPTGGAINARKESSLNAPSGIYCLDPEVGLYHRFSLGKGGATQNDYGQPMLYNGGALFSLLDTERTQSKMLVSYSIFDETQTEHAILGYDDFANTNIAKGFIQFTRQSPTSIIKNIELIHKKLSTGSSIKVYTRLHKDDPIVLDGVWVSTTQFNTTTDASSVVNNNLAYVKQGSGGGQFLRVNTVTEGAVVDVITFQDTNSFVTANDKGVIEILNYKYTGQITDLYKDKHVFTIPFFEESREVDFLIEITQAAGNREELDYSIIET